MDQKTPLINSLVTLPMTHHITINLNIKSPEQAEQTSRLIRNNLTRRLCGRRRQMTYLIFIETGSFTGNLHYHIIINAPHPHEDCLSEAYTTNLLNHIHSFHIKAIATSADAVQVDCINQTLEDKHKLLAYLMKTGTDAFYAPGSHIEPVQ